MKLVSVCVSVVSGSGRPCMCSQEQGCKPCVNLVQTEMNGLHGDGFHVKIRKLGSAKRVWNRTGCARSDFTTCIPVTWWGWGPLVRFKQAVFRVLNFEQISVLTRVATVVQPARGIWTGSYLAHSSFDARCT